MIPWQIKGILRFILDTADRRRAAAERASIRRSDLAGPVLGFGGVLGGGDFVHGGAVKLLSLRDGFRHDEIRFNVLYLVSSAQPKFADGLVRLCQSRGIKFVWNQNGVGYPAWAGSETGRHNSPMRRLRSRADYIVYQSEFCRRSAEKFLGACGVRSQVLFNPVDLAKFSPAAAPLPSKPLRLLAIGTQNYRERVTSVLDCLRILLDEKIACRLTIAGPLIWRNAEEEVRQRVESLRLKQHVHILPPFHQDDAPNIFRNHHILVHPKYMDPCPTVVAEAMACGLPVVASRSGGVPEMVDEECSCLVDVPQSWRILHTPSGRQLADAVRSVWQQLDNCSRAARRRAERNFDAQSWCDRHARIFEELLVAPGR